jgi:hypothetical protein
MGRRYQAEELYEDEYQEEDRTRAAVSSVPSYDDQFEDRTRSARESHLALEGLARSAERPRAARRSYVDAEELLETPARPSFVAPSERRSHVERSERPRQISSPGPVPAPPTPRGSRYSFVASSEREDFASSIPDAEEVTSFREQPLPRRASQHPVRESTYAPAIESSEIEELAPLKRGEQSRPLDYDALKRYLFDDVPAGSPEAAAMSPEDRSVSMQTPVATRPSRRPAMRSSRPEIAPGARISHHAFRPQMHGAVAPVSASAAPQLAQLANLPTVASPIMPPPPASETRPSEIAFRSPMMTGPHMPMMAAPVQTDSYVDSSWIVPTPPFPSSSSPIRQTVATAAGFKITLSFAAAAVTAVAALVVMIGAILFMRSEDAPTATATAAAKLEAPVEAAPVVVSTVAAPVVVPTVAAPAVTAPVAKVEKTETPKKKKVVAQQPKVADDEDEDDAPAPAPPPPSKKMEKKAEKKAPSDKNLERMLADLGEEQLKR